jgi:hypothetical protein
MICLGHVKAKELVHPVIWFERGNTRRNVYKRRHMEKEDI